MKKIFPNFKEIAKGHARYYGNFTNVLLLKTPNRVLFNVKKYKITVAGTGYVGLVAGACFAEIGHEVTCVDVNEEKIKLLNSGKSPIYEKDLEPMLQKNIAVGRLKFTSDYAEAYRSASVIFIGVGTPEQPDGSANLSFLATTSRQIAENIERDCLIVVKSTVPVGTNDKVEKFVSDFLKNDVKIEVASNPEFLSQGTAVRDTLNASRIVIGTESENARRILEEIYEPFNLPIVAVTRRSAEMIKYAANDFLALKISYMNDLANLCELIGVNIKDVAEGLKYDDRIGAKFLNAGIGYGGSCFPKDTRALSCLAKEYGYNLRTVNAAIKINDDQKTVLFRKASKRLMVFGGLRVAVLGVTFKPETNDMREAPSIDNIRLLLENKADVVVYDPVGEESFKKIFPEVSCVSTPEQALDNADICFIFTEWKEIKAIKPEIYKSLMRVPLVYDGRNIYQTSEMKEAGVEYYSVGRP